jgi:phosphoribosylaminoimidazole (AIR) synthetase
MVAVVPADRAPDALALLAGRGVPAWELGRLESAPAGGVELVADYGGAAATWR